VILPMRAAQHDATGGRTLDVSGNGNHAVFGAGAAEPTKRSERGYDFDGGDTLTITGDPIGTGAASVSFVASLTTGGALISNGEFTLTADVANRRLQVTSDDGGTTLDGTSDAWSESTLQAVTVTRTATGAASIYVNGTDAGSGASGTPTAGSDLVIGTSCVGKMLEYIEHDIALTPTQVHDLHADMMRRIHEV